MNISFGAITLPESGTLVLLVAQERCLGPLAAEIDRVSGGALTKALGASRFVGRKEETLALLAPNGLAVDRLLLVGVGKPESADRLAFEAAGGAVVAALARSGETQVAVVVESLAGVAGDLTELAAAVAVGARLRAYRFDAYRTTEKPEQKVSLERIRVLTTDHPAVAQRYEAAVPMLEGVFLTRDLVSEPANVLTPMAFAERCRALAGYGLTIEVLERPRLAELGMNALLGVAQGSAHDPAVVVLHYNGLTPAPGGTADATDVATDVATAAAPGPIALIGKGVTFDSGGISIKSSSGMEEMKWDMAGAGVVAGVMRTLAARKAPVHVVGILGLVENLPSGTAQRPGDVVRSASGQTIEVINTDAEGRLVLADLLWYAQEKIKPRLMIDLATLTGAIIVALGHRYAGLFATDDRLAEALTAAGRAVGEELWRMPMDEAYDKEIASDIADMKNVGSNRDAGSSLGAQFLKRFVREVPWAHLDIAGVTWAKKDTATVPKGGTGFGVRLLDHYITKLTETPAP